MAPGVPLLLQGVTRDADGRGVEWFSVWHRPNTVFDIDARVGSADGVDGSRAARLRGLADELSVLASELGGGVPGA